MSNLFYNRSFVNIDDLKISIEYFNQYEPTNTFSSYELIVYKGLEQNKGYVIKNDTQNLIDENLENEIKGYISRLSTYQQKENDRLNPKPTFNELRQEAVINLEIIYNSPLTWIFTIKDNNSSLTKEQDWLLTKISTNPIFYDNQNNIVQKTFSIEEVFTLINKINTIGFNIYQARLSIENEINAIENKLYNVSKKTQQSGEDKLKQYTQEYIKSELDKVNRVIEVTR